MSTQTFEATGAFDGMVDSKAEPFFQRIWPPAALGFAFAVTAAWVSLLGYGLVSLIELAI